VSIVPNCENTVDVSFQAARGSILAETRDTGSHGKATGTFLLPSYLNAFQLIPSFIPIGLAFLAKRLSYTSSITLYHIQKDKIMDFYKQTKDLAIQAFEIPRSAITAPNEHAPGERFKNA
jgi:hypothetical protein